MWLGDTTIQSFQNVNAHIIVSASKQGLMVLGYFIQPIFFWKQIKCAPNPRHDF